MVTDRPDGAVPPSARRITDHATRVEICRRYVDDGQTCAEIAAAVGVSRDTVWRALRDMGVTMRPRGRRTDREVA